MDDHILFIFLKLAVVLPIFLFMPSSTLPFALITLLRYLNFSTVSIVLPSSLVLPLTFCWKTITLVLSWLILSPTFAAAFFKLIVIICKSSIESAVNAILSAKSRSVSLFYSFHLMPYSSNIIFNNFLLFNFPFFNFEQ